jgi:hypothetical protein
LLVSGRCQFIVYVAGSTSDIITSHKNIPLQQSGSGSSEASHIQHALFSRCPSTPASLSSVLTAL